MSNKPAQNVRSRRNRHDHPSASDLLQKKLVACILVRGDREVCDDGRVIGEQGRAK